ncbi:sugar ABC transporter substrate-binding protein [Thermicanus aegyptius]|uniref:sugar ABC transporter substrate-binding protein n=1 Tax=Thermicanus aegyptius TaxID=94009 RepID=UPI0004131E38|nr:sugar ABC transporter substrate-binding protein [Thermicanus aegyptius]
MIGRKKGIAVLMTLVLIAFAALAGCSSGNGTNSSSPGMGQGSQENQGSSGTQQQKEPVTLEAWIMPNSPQPDKDFLAVLKPFLDQNPNIQVKVTVLDWGSAWSKITTAATSGQGPDILQLGTTWVPAIAAMGALAPLTDQMNELGGAESYYPATWNTTHIAGDNTIYAAPWFVDARALYYRTDVFEKAGLNATDVFKDWNSFKEALKKVNGMEIEGKKISAFGFPGKNDWNVAHNIFPWIWAAGGNVLNEDNTEAIINSKEALDGIMFYTGLAAEGLVSKTTLEQNTSQVEANYANGDYAVMISGPWILKQFTTPKDQGGQKESIAASRSAVHPLPAGPNGVFTFFGGSDLTIFKNTKHFAEAWAVVKYLSGKDAQLAYAQASGQLPAVKEVMNSPDITSDPNMAQFVQAAQTSRSYPSIPQWGPIENVLVKHFGIMWDIVAGVGGKPYNRESIQAEMDAAKQEIDALLHQ